MDTKDILVRGIDGAIYEKLRVAAFENRRSVVAEVRSRLEASFELVVGAGERRGDSGGGHEVPGEVERLVGDVEQGRVRKRSVGGRKPKVREPEVSEVPAGASGRRVGICEHRRKADEFCARCDG